MKQLVLIISMIWSACSIAQDSSYYYSGWGKPSTVISIPRDSIKNAAFTRVTFSKENPVLLEQYDANGALTWTIRNAYDEYGNHLSRKKYDAKEQLREESVFRNNPEEIALFRKVFGATFNPANSNFTIFREYNEFGREQSYLIMGVHGKAIYSRITLYREDRRKDKEVLRDDLNDRLLAERCYKYDDKESRTILEEFNGEGKLVQRVVLFDQHEIIEE
ncbi:MAG: hypothetical protein K9M49_04090 [Candidatus Marinimicrobia bacterium]|nr:hypothetical protein [Candidatus Neomarinimicrobiota bacterium]MCF7851324.1 hypothetical protein [Candidatus Neomarinimicrobiota bacterium]MCF7904315.1 hypothetical protein [Candidatus Neomarinimicrobiota bacterium]